MTESPQATFVETVSCHLAESLSQKFKVLVHSSSEAESVLEDVFRFVHGAESNSNGQPWEDRAKQEALRKALDALLKPSDLKRRREAEDTSTGANAKRAKLGLGGDIQDDGAPQYILHAVSATSPVRRKVDLVVTASSLKLVNASSQATEAAIALGDLKRAFVLPTRGKTKPHWTVVILSADSQDKAAPSPQVIFGLDAAVGAAFSVTAAASGSEKTAVKKGDATLPYIRAFLSTMALPNPVYETDTTVFKSASSKEPCAGTEAYLGAKVGSLWFLKEGVLWGESKPCEFWPAESLLDIRVVSATGRQCSATIVRRVEEGYEDGEGDGEETQFTFIDGREQDGIGQWVRRYRKIPSGTKPPPVLAAGPITINSLAAESDDEDEDFEDKDEESEEENTDSSDDEEENEEEADASGEDDDAMYEDEEEELKSEHHPLMRPGAMPKMSRAAMDMVVDMVEGDLMGNGDEVDELDD